MKFLQFSSFVNGSSAPETSGPTTKPETLFPLSFGNVASSLVSGRPTFSAWLDWPVPLPVLVPALIAEGGVVSRRETKAAVVPFF